MSNKIFLRIFIIGLILYTGFNTPSFPAVIILTSDQQLSDLMDPDKKIDLSTGNEKYFASLREICESAKKRNDKVLTIAFDEFFRQYRDQAGTERRLMPDMDEYINKIKFISDFAAKYGMGIGLSLLSPLELGPSFKNSTGQSGKWVSYKVGYRNPTTGEFSISMNQQLFWTNNKGKFRINLKKVRAYAFKEVPVGFTTYRAVNPDDIVELSNVQYNVVDTIRTMPNSQMWYDPSTSDEKGMYFMTADLHIYQEGEAEKLKGYNRVLVILEYETPEMDYFSPQALPFLENLMKKYYDKKINLVSLYSDEMHIQQDWYYFNHHENGQFNERYLTDNFSAAYQKQYSQPLDEKYMLYFVYGPMYFANAVKSVRNFQYVMGTTPEDIQRTFLLRDRYYKMLNNNVVDLFKEAKSYANSLYKRELESSAHASWAESPTIDFWDTEKLNENAAKYEYTSNYLWGNTVQQASAACYDYFKWGEYLEPTGNDFAECGWLDRDYYGAAMAASIGVINKYPNAYAAAWGMPEKSAIWKRAINSAFGARSGALTDYITGGVHRDIEPLILYPLSLVAVEERFGSWMTQYAYANYLTASKLLSMGKITEDGWIQVGDKRYNTLVAVFEPLPAKGLLEMMAKFAEKGGTVIWCGPPPLINGAGENCSASWQKLFGVDYSYDIYMGEIAAGKEVTFKNRFSHIPEQVILTDFLVDRIYPVKPGNACEVLAEVDGRIVGTGLQNGKGKVYYFGFRPRDDQSASLGYESRTMFEILNTCGAYKPTGHFAGINDNPTYISRTTDYFVTRFPNRATVIVKHYRTHPENWQGGFARNEEADAKALAINPLPSDTMILNDMKVNGHDVTYNGKMIMAFRTDDKASLTAFEGHECSGLDLDGKKYEFAGKPMETIFFSLSEAQKGENLILIKGEGKVSLPVPVIMKKKLQIVSPDNKKVPCKIENGIVEFLITPQLSGKMLRIL